MKIRSAHWYIVIGLFFIAIAIMVQIKLISGDAQLKPLDPVTTRELCNPQGNSIGGNPDGNVTLVEFFDYNCKYCREIHPKIKALITANPDLRIVYKEFLLFGKPSIAATSAALAAQNQGKYVALQDALLQATQPLAQDEIMKIAQKTGLDVKKLAVDMATPKVQEQVQANTALAEKSGIDGAPVFIVANSQIAQSPEKTTIPQYVFKGSSQAEIALQHLIDKVKKDNQ